MLQQTAIYIVAAYTLAKNKKRNSVYFSKPDIDKIIFLGHLCKIIFYKVLFLKDTNINRTACDLCNICDIFEQLEYIYCFMFYVFSD